MFDFTFIKLTDNEEGMRFNWVTKKYKKQYVGQKCERISDYEPCLYRFYDGAVWSLDKDQVKDPHLVKKENVSHKKRTPVRCVETGEVFESTYEAGERVNRSVKTIRSACYTGTPSAGFHWEYVGDEK